MSACGVDEGPSAFLTACGVGLSLLALGLVARVLFLVGARSFSRRADDAVKAARNALIGSLPMPAFILSTEDSTVLEANAVARRIFEMDDDVVVREFLLSPAPPRLRLSTSSLSSTSQDTELRSSREDDDLAENFTTSPSESSLRLELVERRQEEDSAPKGATAKIELFTNETLGGRKVLSKSLKTGRALQFFFAEKLTVLDAHSTLAILRDATELLEATYELTIQRKILAQVAHEVRNKYAPASSMLELVRDLVAENAKDNKNVTKEEADGLVVKELRARDEDIALSIALLREADDLIKTRLDLHKLLKGSYVSAANVQTFDVLEVMRGRTSAAASVGTSNAKKVAFEARVSLRSSSLEKKKTEEEEEEDAFCHPPPTMKNKKIHEEYADDDDDENDRHNPTNDDHSDDDDDHSDDDDESDEDREDRHYVRCDLYIFDHIASNLLGNARKACGATVGKVVFSFLGAQANGTLLFSVRDNGRGVPALMRSRLFLEEVTSADVRGVGLGLASCRAFAAAVGGDVFLYWTQPCTAEQPNGSGTEFRFYLPGKIVERTASGWSSAKKTSSRGTRARGTTPQQCPRRALDDSASSSTSSNNYESSTKKKSNFPSDVVCVICEDSQLIRKAIIQKMRTIAKSITAEKPWTFVEHETVESLLPALSTFLSNPNSLVVIDENLDAQGGILKGSDLIRALVNNGYQGLLVSSSGNDAVAETHASLGAHLTFSKPLPPTAHMMHELDKAFARNRKKHKKANNKANNKENNNNITISQQ